MESMKTDPKTPTKQDLDTLKERFGYDSFRVHQFEGVYALKSGKNVFLRKPTGGGKSLIYQYLAAESSVLVLSPLIALMDDQVAQAKKFGVKAACMHSQQDHHERGAALESWASGEVNLLFVTPERFGKDKFRKILSERKPDFFVLDEAHCASQWGHDFRPDYSKVGEIREFLGKPPTLACTATATEKTEEDVVKVLGLEIENTERYYDSVIRENLTCHVEACFDFEEKRKNIIELIKTGDGPLLIYFSLIKNLEQFGEYLESIGLYYVKYHSKLPSHIRRKNQKKFIKGDCDLMLATPAFGLGVDKPDIRSVVHFELPGSVEAYVQEFGRAGRDGQNSNCHLFYSQEDIQVQMDFIKWGHPDADTIRWVHRRICETKETGYPINTLDELKKKMNFYNSYDFRMESAINILLRWECLISEKGILSEGPAPVEAVPDVAQDISGELVKSQQMKLYELIQLIRLEGDEFKSFLSDYFGES